MNRLSFDPESHTYTIGKQVIPNVTRILEKMGAYNGFRFASEADLEAARVLGDYVHKMIAMDNKNELDESDLDPALIGYLNSWKLFKDATGFKAELIEHKAYSQIHGYAGTLDLFGEFKDGTRALIDLKTGTEQRADAVQLGAYEWLLLELGYGNKAFTKGCLYLDGNGKLPKWKPHTDRNDKNIFFALLTAYRWLGLGDKHA